MRNTSTWAICLMLLFFTTSCSMYDRVAVWHKYRGEYRVHKVNPERLASKGRAAQPAQPTSTPQTTEALPAEPIYASAEAPVAAQTATAASTSARALAKGSSPRASTQTPVASARPEKLSFRQALKLKKALKSPSSRQSGNKSQIVAALLAFFLGGLGIHRFYLGYTWQGVVQLFTFGGFFIWAFIDLIRIIVGDLEPKNGSYYDTF